EFRRRSGPGASCDTSYTAPDPRRTAPSPGRYGRTPAERPAWPPRAGPTRRQLPAQRGRAWRRSGGGALPADAGDARRAGDPRKRGAGVATAETSHARPWTGRYHTTVVDAPTRCSFLSSSDQK